MSILEVKSKFYADCRRFSLDCKRELLYEELYRFLERLHELNGIAFVIEYSHPVDGGILPINNNDNYNWAVKTCCDHPNRRPIIRLYLSRRGESVGETLGYNLSGAGINLNSHSKGGGIVQRWELLHSLRNTSDGGSLPGGSLRSGKSITSLRSSGLHPHIQLKNDFRVVSSIIDVDCVPVAYRRVRLVREDARPLGFFIRTGTSMRITDSGIERVQGIFISKLVPGGLAEMTGLIGVDDEVIEVNGIEVQGKTLDQVTDMMVANSSNLIITLKPASEKNTLLRPPRSKTQELSRTTPSGDVTRTPSISSATDAQYSHVSTNSQLQDPSQTLRNSTINYQNSNSTTFGGVYAGSYDSSMKNMKSTNKMFPSHNPPHLSPSTQFDLVGDMSLGDEDAMSFRNSTSQFRKGPYEY